jgi:hypothetical protein
MSDAVSRSRSTRHLRTLAIVAGALLFLIGVRFLLVPESAARTFGLARGAGLGELAAIVGLRDLWLGALAVLLAVLCEWRALSLWLLLGAGVCLADAAIAGGSSGKALAIAFHIGSGIFCLALGLAFWRHGRPEG